MKGICPNCEEVRGLEKISKVETINIKDEKIDVDCTFFVCNSCGAEFEDPKEKINPVEEAYRIYRSQYGFLQPEEIKAFRNKHGLTQQELSLLLGWGLATLSRYENGALQDSSHEKALHLAMDPSNLLKLVKETPKTFSDKRRNELIENLRNEQEEAYPFQRIYEDRFGKYKPNIYSGYKKLDVSKLFSVILFFCTEGALKTKLNKLLFYADFIHFKKYSTSITGLYYAHLQHGLVPDNYDYYFATLMNEDKSISLEEIEFSTNITGELYTSQTQPNLNIFDESELETMIEVKKRFKDASATQIKNISHKESAYKKTSPGNYISYEYAEEIVWE